MTHRFWQAQSQDRDLHNNVLRLNGPMPVLGVEEYVEQLLREGYVPERSDGLSVTFRRTYENGDYTFIHVWSDH